MYYSTTHKSILVLLCMHCVGVCCRQVSGKFLNGSLLFARFPSKLMSSCTKFKCNTKMDIKLIYFQSFAPCPISLFPIKCKFIYPCSCLFCFSSCCEILGAFFFFLILLTRWTLLSFAVKDELPKNAWLVSKMGRLTVGVQYEPQCKFCRELQA